MTWNPKDDLNPNYKGGVIADPDWFRRHYVAEGRSLREVARLAGRSLRTAARWAKKHGVETRATGRSSGDTTLVGPWNPNWGGGPPTCECGAELRYGRDRCRACYKKTMFGPGNPNWKGIADIKVLVRSALKKTWTPAVFLRDGYTCMSCGDSSGGNLTAHHIVRLAVIIDDLVPASDPRLETPDGRLTIVRKLLNSRAVKDLSNGVTLCEDCHSSAHEGEMTDVVMPDLRYRNRLKQERRHA